MNKTKLAQSFVLLRAKMERQTAQGLAEDLDEDGTVVRFCVKRFLNVLLGSVMNTKLTTQGASLNRAGLQEKLYTDKEFHRDQLKEYNDQLKYNDHVWEDVYVGLPGR